MKLALTRGDGLATCWPVVFLRCGLKILTLFEQADADGPAGYCLGDDLPGYDNPEDTFRGYCPRLYFERKGVGSAHLFLRQRLLSAIRHSFQFFRVPGALHRDFCGGDIDVMQIIGREFDREGTEVFV